MRRLVKLGLVCTALLAAFWPASARASAERQVLRLKLVATDSWNVDNDPSGPSGGDLYGSSGNLRRHGHKLGTYASACTGSSATTAECNATLVFTGGKDRIQIAGLLDFQTLTTGTYFSIVGGTGKYRGARGEGKVTPLDQNPALQRARFVILK